MKTKIIAILIIINLILIGTIYSLINKENVNNQKQIIKEMSETECESSITSLNQSHTDYANYIQTCKSQIASAITDMGLPTSEEDTLETMASNIRNIDTNDIISGSMSASSVSGKTATFNTGITGYTNYIIQPSLGLLDNPYYQPGAVYGFGVNISYNSSNGVITMSISDSKNVVYGFNGTPSIRYAFWN